MKRDATHVSQVKVVAAIGNVLARDVVREATAHTSTMRVTGEAQNWSQLAEVLDREPPHLLLMSATLPSLSVHEDLAVITRRPGLRVVLLTRAAITA